MVYIFYKTTNKINDKIYYGVHSTKKQDDDYLGSGVNLRRAIKKYGKKNFIREDLKLFETEKEMYEFEKEFINERLIYQENIYNMTIGGVGGFSHIKSTKGQPKSEAYKQKMSEIHKERFSKMSEKEREERKDISKRNLLKAVEKNTGNHHSEETKRKISEGNIGKTLSQESREKMSKSKRGKGFTEKAKENMSNSRKKSYQNGNEHIINFVYSRKGTGIRYEFVHENGNRFNGTCGELYDNYKDEMDLKYPNIFYLTSGIKLGKLRRYKGWIITKEL